MTCDDHLRASSAAPVVVGLVETTAGGVHVVLRVGDDRPRGAAGEGR